MKKKILALCLVVVLVATAITGVTLAYFTDDDSATNTFTVGNVEIDLIEPEWDEQGKEDAPEVYPGEALAKDPQVTNEGANPCFVRIKVEGLDCLNNVGAGDITLRWIDEDGNYHDGYNTRDWEYLDGYYYYKKPLCVEGTEGESWNAGLAAATTELFSQIVIPGDLKNGDGETEFDIPVLAEAVQAQGAKPSWSDVKGMSVAEIAAWFATCMA